MRADQSQCKLSHEAENESGTARRPRRYEAGDGHRERQVRRENLKTDTGRKAYRRQKEE